MPAGGEKVAGREDLILGTDLKRGATNRTISAFAIGRKAAAVLAATATIVVIAAVAITGVTGAGILLVAVVIALIVVRNAAAVPSSAWTGPDSLSDHLGDGP